ncbi:transcriptional regulator domain-containing protein [Asticcacaulis machinosus]|uniref:transcriptional regulator domain-containing protein n=1 Tax=Asticcacaulis machinosus TaxID=2984211 RepID=UPI0034A4CEB1
MAQVDWREASAYHPLLKMDRAGWAWLWLRRNERYRDRGGRDLNIDLKPVRNEVQIIRARSAFDAGHWGVSFRRRR